MVTKPLLGTQLNYGHPLTRGLIGCYLFNEQSGKRANDLTRLTGPGTLTNMALTGPSSNWSGSNDGSGIFFDGTNDHVVSTSGYAAMTATTPFTFCCWYRYKTAGKYLIARKAATNEWFPLLVTTSFNCSKANVNEEGNPAVTLKVGSWYFGCGTYDGTTMRHYINGGMQGSFIPNATSLSATSNTSGLYTVGARFLNSISQSPFDDIVSHALIYNRCLTSGEVALLNQDPYIYIKKKSVGLSYYTMSYGLGAWKGNLAAAGASGTLTATSASSVIEAGMAISFKKA